MGASTRLSPSLLLLLSIASSLANPIPVDRVILPQDDEIDVLQQNAPSTVEPAVSAPLDYKLSCENTGADRCLLFPIGCIPGVNCSDRLQIQRIHSGTNEGEIVVSLNLHVSHTSHMLVAVPMPDVSNPNSTFLVGCSVDGNAAVIARPDVDGVTEQLQVSWLRKVDVQATDEDLVCIVVASPGHIGVPEGDVAVFAGDVEEEVPAAQSARIAGSLSEDELVEEERKGGEKAEPEVGPEVRLPEGRKDVVVEGRIEKVQSPLAAHGKHAIPALEHSEGPTPILRSIEDHSPDASTTQESITTPTTVSAKSTKLRLKQLHSSEGSSVEKHHHHEHQHTSFESTHAVTHHHHTTTTTTTVASTTEQVKQEEERSTETPSSTLAQDVIEEAKGDEPSTTVSLPRHEQHRHQELQHAQHLQHHSHEHRASIDSEHHSVRLPPVTTTTTTHKPKSFEEDKELSEEDKELLREMKAGHMKPERREEDGDEEEEDEEELSDHTHADGSQHAKHVTTYELTREAAQDPIGKRPSEHTHHHDHSHAHDSHHRAAEDEEDEDTGAKRRSNEKKEDEDDDEEEELPSEDERGERMGEKRHQRRERDEDEEDEDDSSSSLSLIIPLIVSIAPVVFG